MVWVVLALEGILLILFVVSHWRYHKSKIQFSIRFDGKKSGDRANPDAARHAHSGQYSACEIREGL